MITKGVHTHVYREQHGCSMQRPGQPISESYEFAGEPPGYKLTQQSQEHTNPEAFRSGTAASSVNKLYPGG